MRTKVPEVVVNCCCNCKMGWNTFIMSLCFGRFWGSIPFGYSVHMNWFVMLAPTWRGILTSLLRLLALFFPMRS